MFTVAAVRGRLSLVALRLLQSPALVRTLMGLPPGSRLRRAALERFGRISAGAFNRRDWSSVSVLPDDVEFQPREDLPDPSSRRGGAEIRRYFEELIEQFPDYRIELIGVEDPGGDVAVFLWHSMGTGAASGISADTYIRQSVEFRDGRVVRIEEKLDSALARLRPPSGHPPTG